MAEPLPIACGLEDAERPARAEAIAALGARLEAVEARGRSATLDFEVGSAPQVAEFVEAESRCCPFFSFEQTEDAGGVRLAVTVPEHGEWALRGLVAGFTAGWQGLL
jgi:hypothetical protein